MFCFTLSDWQLSRSQVLHQASLFHSGSKKFIKLKIISNENAVEFLASTQTRLVTYVITYLSSGILLQSK